MKRLYKFLIITNFILSSLIITGCGTVPGTLDSPYVYEIFYEISDQKVIDNKIYIGVGWFGDALPDPVGAVHQNCKISVIVDDEENVVKFIEIENEELYSEGYYVSNSYGKAKKTDFGKVYEFDILDYEIKKYIKFVLSIEQHNYICDSNNNNKEEYIYANTFFDTLKIEGNTINNEFIVSDYSYYENSLM